MRKIILPGLWIFLTLACAPALLAQPPQLIPINPRPGGFSSQPVYQTAALPGSTPYAPGGWQAPTRMPAGSIAVQNAPGFHGGGNVYSPPVYHVAQAPGTWQGQVYTPRNLAAPAVQQAPVWNPNPYGNPYANPYGNSWQCNQKLWTVQINGLYMKRARPHSFPLLIQPGGGIRVNADEFDFGWHGGFDVGLSRRFGAYQNIELRYFQIDSWTAVVSSPYQPFDRIGTDPRTLVLLPAGTVDYNYDSRLLSFEANLVSRFVASDRVRLGIGFRYLRLRESLNTAFSVTDAEMTINTRNNLYGLQFAGDGVLINSGRFSVVTWVKAGIYANSGKQETTVGDAWIPNPPLFVNGIDRTTASFVGETGLMGAFQITPCLSLTGGYQLLWVSGAALAADQLPNMGNFGGGFVPATLDQSDVFYHGAIFGIELHF